MSDPKLMDPTGCVLHHRLSVNPTFLLYVLAHTSSKETLRSEYLDMYFLAHTEVNLKLKFLNDQS